MLVFERLDALEYQLRGGHDVILTIMGVVTKSMHCFLIVLETKPGLACGPTSCKRIHPSSMFTCIWYLIRERISVDSLT